MINALDNFAQALYEFYLMKRTRRIEFFPPSPSFAGWFWRGDICFISPEKPLQPGGSHRFIQGDSNAPTLSVMPLQNDLPSPIDGRTRLPELRPYLAENGDHDHCRASLNVLDCTHPHTNPMTRYHTLPHHIISYMLSEVTGGVEGELNTPREPHSDPLNRRSSLIPHSPTRSLFLISKFTVVTKWVRKRGIPPNGQEAAADGAARDTGKAVVLSRRVRNGGRTDPASRQTEPAL